MVNEKAVQELRAILQRLRPDAPDENDRTGARIREAKDSVRGRYVPVFAPEGISSLDAETFRGFLRFENNQHWSNLHRQGGWMTENMEKLRKALGILVDETMPIRTRLNRLRPPNGDPMVKGLARSVITAMLQIVYPDKYGVLNGTAEAGMKQLGVWPEIKTTACLADRYDAVNGILRELADALEIDLWTLDLLWWRVTLRGSPSFELGTREVGGSTGTSIPVEADGGDAAFGLERHLHEFLLDNWSATELGTEWNLFEEDGETVGSEYNTGEVGYIDLLAKHVSQNRWLVIELKRGQTSDDTAGQLLRYMSWIRRNLAETADTVEGLIICRAIDKKLQYALDGQPNVRCMTYRVRFSLDSAPVLGERETESPITPGGHNDSEVDGSRSENAPSVGAGNLRDAIISCFGAHNGGPLAIRDVAAWIELHFPGRWKDVSTAMADLTVGGNTSSPYRDSDKCLIRVSRGVYRLADAYQRDTVQARPMTDRTTVTVPADKRRADSSAPDMTEFWAPGIPATFATAGERPWRECLEQAIAEAAGRDEHSGVSLSFSVESLRRGGHPFDLDNLCEPVISVLVNGKGWFRGRRPNIRWWSAERHVASTTGCRIHLADDVPDDHLSGQTIFEGVYAGEFPSRATDTRIADWLTNSVLDQRARDRHFGVGLCFGTDAINLGDIATGPVKSIIDNLYPLLGGAVGVPEDWRIERLLLCKGHSDLASNELRITIHSLQSQNEILDPHS